MTRTTKELCQFHILCLREMTLYRFPIEIFTNFHFKVSQTENIALIIAKMRC